ncbi:MAG: hypothetical protein RL210_2261 [Pseudomonadota bacterium]|jgi:hypothetical protein|nr:hypothetical protein [Pseudomonadota bacterium]
MVNSNANSESNQQSLAEVEQGVARDTDRRGTIEPEDREILMANLLLNGNEQRGGFGRRKEDQDKWLH